MSTTSLKKRTTFRGLWESFIVWALYACATISILTTLTIVLVLLNEAVFGFGDDKIAFFQEKSFWKFISGTEWDPQYGDFFGVLPLVTGTLITAGIAALVGLPVGVTSAVYMSEYASPKTRSFIKPSLEILAGIPTVVYGYFALAFLTPYIIKPVLGDWMGFQVGTFNALSGGIVVGVMIIPMVSSLSEDVLRSVPRSLREGAYALGATKFDVSVKVIIPAALSGIIASFLLAISRAIGETMAVTLAAGNRPVMALNFPTSLGDLDKIIQPLDQVQTMTAYIASTSGSDVDPFSVEYQSIYAVALSLFAVTLFMNILSQIILSKFREAYQ